jgi:hypothetical protein
MGPLKTGFWQRVLRGGGGGLAQDEGNKQNNALL